MKPMNQGDIDCWFNNGVCDELNCVNYSPIEWFHFLSSIISGINSDAYRYYAYLYAISTQFSPDGISAQVFSCSTVHEETNSTS
mgnify:CR=1 FL=1